MPKNILIVAGEPSGDLHASNLVKEIAKISPDIEFFGLGGSLMSNAGVRIICGIADLAIIGLYEVLKNIFAIRDAYAKILREIDSKKPDIAILVDYPGFNLRLAKVLKRRNIPIIYYISPQAWAWGEDRIKIIKETVAKIVVFFKFEEELYKKRGVPAEFVGHPLVDVAKSSLTKVEAIKKYGLDPAKKIIALLPGSRRMEVESLLPIMLKSAIFIARKIPDMQFVVARFSGLEEDLYKKITERHPLCLRLAYADTYNVLNAADFAIVTSGTATLETAIIGAPMVIVYKTSPMTYIAFKLVSKVKNVGIVNIIAGREVVPEFLQFDATAEKIASKVIEIMLSPTKTLAMKDEFSNIKSSLGSPGSYSRAALSVLSCL